MKKTIGFSFLLFISANILYGQHYELIEVGKPIKFGDQKGELGKNLQFKNDKALNFFPDDITVDIENNFYVCDKFSKTIIKYDSLLNFVSEMKIEDFNLHGKLVKGFEDTCLIPVELTYKVELATDTDKNLYCLIMKDAHIYRFIKYNERGIWVNEFNLYRTLPPQLGINSFHISNNKIFISTRIEFSLGKGYSDFMQKNVFVYDLEGRLLERCNYYLEDYKGKPYQRNTLNKKDLLWIDQYLPPLNKRVLPTSELTVNASLDIELKPNTGFEIGEIDRNNILYFIGLNPFTVVIFNFKDNTVRKVEEVGSFRERLYKESKTLIPNFGSLKVSYNGDIFVCGMKSYKDYDNRYEESDANELEFSILKLNFKTD